MFNKIDLTFCVCEITAIISGAVFVLYYGMNSIQVKIALLSVLFITVAYLIYDWIQKGIR